MRRILFRADANGSIGTGDIISFMWLANRFISKGWQTYFIIRDYDIGIKLVEKHQILNVTVLKENISTQDEIEFINSFIAQHQISVIFLQINERSLDEYNQLTNDVYKCCVCFDYNMPLSFDLALSWDIDSEKYFNFAKYHQTVFFLGPEYVPLTDNFTHYRTNNREYKTPRKKLLVSMGGADKDNITLTVAQNLIELKCDLELVFIVGAGYSSVNQLRETLSSIPAKVTIKKNISNMFEQYMECDVAIGSGGLTASELIATQTPAFLVATYKHQITRCKYFEKRAWAKFLGFRDLSALNMQDLCTFIPNRDNKFQSRIDEAVNYINELG